MSALLIGAGERGYSSYAPYALKHPDELRFVAVAEPHEVRRLRFASAHGIPPKNQFHNWEELLNSKPMADVALICTQDHMHVSPAQKALEAGYHVLLEKPMAVTLPDCLKLVKTAEKTGNILQICHVLRYTPFFSTLHEIIQSGRLGEIISVEHRENVVYWHMAHSYVRGNWRNSQQACPMILAKCCHDLDLLFWNLGRCKKLSSFGSLKYFRNENAPAGAPERCLDGCPASNDCPWYAPRLYLEYIPLYQTARLSSSRTDRLGAALLLDHPNLTKAIKKIIPPFEKAVDYRGWPISVISEDSSLEARLSALENGPWGRCVFHCDNDVVDHQVVNMELENGSTAVLVMHGHSHEDGRTMRYEGTRATLRGRFLSGLDDSLEIHDHGSGRKEKIKFPARNAKHGGGDEGLMAAFIQSARGNREILTSARASLESHLMAFAAEQARLEGKIIDLSSVRQQIGS
jgi:predicted dehydrogenase